MEPRNVRWRRGDPEERPEVSAQKQAATSKMASVFLVSGSPLRRPRSREPPAGPARATRPILRPARAANGKLRMARPACRGRSEAPRCLQAREGSVRPGGVGTAYCRPRRDGAYTQFGLHVSPDSPCHGAANWLGDMAGCLSALALCGTLLPGNRRLGTGVCDVILQADQ